VLILARMREEYDRTGSTSAAVVGAAARTGRLVTCAAVILAISFVYLSLSPDIVVAMIATGLAVGMGRRSWWMSTGLARLPPASPGFHRPRPASAGPTRSRRRGSRRGVATGPPKPRSLRSFGEHTGRA
jgi:RND superfamily putative drug exporter